jgi:anti-sigma regulatory factor (Ser/Thr protein kinase)
MTDSTLWELELSSDPRRLPVVRAQVRDWTIARGWSVEQADEIVLALDEALTNVIRHGYGGQPDQKILVCLRSVTDPVEGEGLEVRVRDFGKQVDPQKICGRDLNDIRPGGLGVHIIKSMNSFVEYQTAEGGGMLLLMRKWKTHRAGLPANQG